TVAVMLFVLPGYRTFPFRVSPLAPLIGVVGAAAWIGICLLHPEDRLLEAVHLGDWAQQGARSAYNPLAVLADTPAWAYGFLAVRFFGLVVVVAVMEEFFLRGFLMRYVIAEDWWKLGIGDVNRLAIATVTVFPMLYHPERIAALVWFSLVTWLMLKTRNIWDCVIAHAVTNLVLGVYVVWSGHWWLM
ncbi:MAG: CAAX prenyl protease-related protein, partial [Thermoguttaceae bacterium]